MAVESLYTGDTLGKGPVLNLGVDSSRFQVSICDKVNYKSETWLANQQIQEAFPDSFFIMYLHGIDLPRIWTAN